MAVSAGLCLIGLDRGDKRRGGCGAAPLILHHHLPTCLIMLLFSDPGTYQAESLLAIGHNTAIHEQTPAVEIGIPPPLALLTAKQYTAAR